MKRFFKGVFKILEKIFRAINFALISLLIILTIVILIWMFVYSDSPKEWLELRICNLVEYQLDKNDGITNEEMLKAIGIATERTIVARHTCSSKMIEDAYRHFSWNMKGTIVLGEEKMKIIADNHEYAVMINDDVLDLFYSKYKNYRENGKWPFNALCLALNDSKKYVVPCRKCYVLSLDEDLENQKVHYDRYTVMDFWNNAKGREFSHYFEKDDFELAFSDARALNEIIETYKDVDEYEYNIISDYIINQTIY